MTGIVAGIGVRAILGGIVGKAASAGTSALKWLGSLDPIHLLAIALAVLLAVDHIGLIVAHRHTAKVEKQLKAAVSELSTARANETALKKAIADQNAAITSIGAKSAEQQKAGAQASQAAQERAREAEATAARLRAGKHSAGLKSAPSANCEPSDTLKGQWK